MARIAQKEKSDGLYKAILTRRGVNDHERLEVSVRQLTQDYPAYLG